MKRAAPIRSGGIVSTATRIARYVEPQTTYTIPRQSHTSVGEAAWVAVVVGAVPAAPTGCGDVLLTIG
jgi:hypothetical protein